MGSKNIACLWASAPHSTSTLLHSSGTFCSTWAEGLQPRHFALWWQSFCFRYLVRALGDWQYGWYVVTRVWEISQAYEVFRGSVGSVQLRLDWHENSDLGSEVSIVTDLNSTMHRLIESVALLTKSIGIITPLILSVIVVVAPRLISYIRTIQASHQIISYKEETSMGTRLYRIVHGLWWMGGIGKRKESSPMSLRSKWSPIEL